MNLITKLIREEEGQSMVEYGLIIGVVAVVCAGTYKLIGTTMNDMLKKLADKIKGYAGNI